MCMADIRISRFVKTTYSEIVATGSDQIIAAASKQRVGVEIYYVPGLDTLPVVDDLAFVAIDKEAVVLGSIPIQILTVPLKWTFAEDGDTPQREFHGLDMNGNTGFFIVIERWLPESILNAYLEKLGG